MSDEPINKTHRANMQTISLSDVVLVDTLTVTSDGRLYIGEEHAGEEYRVAIIDQGTDEE